MKKIKLRDEQGAVTVEFAIISILLFTIVFGIIEFGLLMFDKHVLTNASREGARAGIVMRAQFDYDGTTINRVSDDEIETPATDKLTKLEDTVTETTFTNLFS